MKAKIYHNPRCSKSRQALELLRQNGVEPVIIEYLKHPPDKQELKALLKLLGMRPEDLLRKNEHEYRERFKDKTGLADEDLIQAMVESPSLIERPIVVINDKAVLGRPPENVLRLL